MLRAFFALILAAALAACTPTTGPDDTNPPAPTSVAMTALADLPMAGGDVTGIAIAPDNTIVAAIDGKLYTMPGGGGALRLLNGDPRHMSIGVAPSGEIYAVTDAEIRVYDPVAGTFRSTPIDPAGPLAQSRRVEQADVCFSANGDPYISLTNNTPQVFIYFSTDHGATWQRLTMPPAFQYSGGFAFAPNGDMLLTNPFGFYRSSDRGATWKTSPPPLANYGGDLTVTTNGDIYYYVRGGGGLKVSHDGGASFTDLSQFNRAPFFVSVRQGADGALYALANSSVTSADPSVRPTTLLRSTDGGVTWTLAFYAQGRVLALRGSTIAVGLVAFGSGAQSRHGGILLSTDAGARWTSFGTTAVQQITDVGFDAQGSLLLLADNGLYRRTQAGWQTLGVQPGAFGRMATNAQGDILIANTGAVYISTDGGVTWKEKALPTAPPGLDPVGVTAILGMTSGDFLLATAGYSDARGYSNGHVYRIAHDGTVTVSTASTGFSKIVQDRNGTLYGGTQTVDGFTNQFVGYGYRSTDGGATWTEAQGNPAAWAFNSRNSYFSIDGVQAFSLKTLGSTTGTSLKLEGFTSQGNSVTSVAFDQGDHLYVITADKGLFFSNAAVR